MLTRLLKGRIPVNKLINKFITMQTYSFTCSCGDAMTVEASNHAEAVTKFKDMMTAESIAAHFAEKHEGETAIPSVEEVHTAIEAGVTPTE